MKSSVIRVMLALVVAASVGGSARAQSGSGNDKKAPTTHGQSGAHSQAGHSAHVGGNLPIGTRTTGVWLDDATVIDPGSSLLAISWDRWESPLGSQQFFPSTSFSIGVNNRVQAQASIPYMYGGSGQAFSSASLGDVYAGAKIAVAGLSGPVGLALIPTVEILGAQYATGSDRLHWVLPASVEFRGGPARVYATTGYFSRGAVFVGGAVDGQVTNRVALVGSLTLTHPVGTQASSDGTLATSQVDVGGGVFVSVTDRFAVFGNVGRTISQLQQDSTSSLVSVGVAITLRQGTGGVLLPR